MNFLQQAYTKTRYTEQIHCFTSMLINTFKFNAWLFKQKKRFWGNSELQCCIVN